MWSAICTLLCLLYVNDLIQVSQLRFTLIFADDTNVSVHGPELDDLTKLIEKEVGKISEWMFSSTLSHNIDEINFIIYGPNLKFSLCRPVIKAVHKIINHVDEVKF